MPNNINITLMHHFEILIDFNDPLSRYKIINKILYMPKIMYGDQEDAMLKMLNIYFNQYQLLYKKSPQFNYHINKSQINNLSLDQALLNKLISDLDIIQSYVTVVQQSLFLIFFFFF